MKVQIHQVNDHFKHPIILTLPYHHKEKAVCLSQLKEVEAISVTKEALKNQLDSDHH